jgi:hypothetical protein
LTLTELWEHWGRRLRQSPEHEQTVERLLGLYRERGLLPDGLDLSLQVWCPNKDECWRDCPPPKDSVGMANSGITIPWLGRGYFETRIVLLGMNFDNYGGIAGHYNICEDHIRSMEAGRRGKAGFAFSRNAMLYLRAALASLDDGPVPTDPHEVPNEALAHLWERCAFIETVKCAPGTKSSQPTDAMFRNCPEFLLGDELAILEPSVILLFGRSRLRDEVRRWSVPEAGRGAEQGPHIERDRALIDGRSVELISLNHPSAHANDVQASLDQLARSLTQTSAAQIVQPESPGGDLWLEQD